MKNETVVRMELSIREKLSRPQESKEYVVITVLFFRSFSTWAIDPISPRRANVASLVEGSRNDAQLFGS